MQVGRNTKAKYLFFKYLAFSFVGMKPLEVRYNGQSELKIKLEEEVAEMDEVVVAGIVKKSQESFTGSVSTITEKELKSFRGRNLLSTLKNIAKRTNWSILGCDFPLHQL